MTEIRKLYRRPHAPVSRVDPVEEALVRTIHRAVGGPAKLSTYDDPADVRDVVLRALIAEQHTAPDRARIERGDLSALERRVVRTVTNRGAAVRSRMRQRRELQRLRDELAAKEERLRAVEAQLAKLAHDHGLPLPKVEADVTKKTDAAFRPYKTEIEPVATPSEDYSVGARLSDEGETSFHSSDYSASSRVVNGGNSCAASSMDSLFGADHAFMPQTLNTSLDCQNFANLVDPLY